jgi:hypothetical protein
MTPLALALAIVVAAVDVDATDDATVDAAACPFVCHPAVKRRDLLFAVASCPSSLGSKEVSS